MRRAGAAKPAPGKVEGVNPITLNKGEAMEYTGIGRGDFVRKKRPFDGTFEGGAPCGSRLKVVDVADHTPIDGRPEHLAIALLEDRTWEFVWNLHKEEAMESKHTPVPWDVHENLTLEIHPLHDEGGEHVIAEIPGDASGDKRGNAEFIVRACNAHEEMLEACKKALAVFTHMTSEDFAQGKDKSCRNLLETIIAKAEGRV